MRVFENLLSSLFNSRDSGTIIEVVANGEGVDVRYRNKGGASKSFYVATNELPARSDTTGWIGKWCSVKLDESYAVRAVRISDQLVISR